MDIIVKSAPARCFLNEALSSAFSGSWRRCSYFEVQRSSRSEARKEELRRQELEAMRQRDEDLAREVELLKKKLEELEQLAKGRGIAGYFNFRNAQGPENEKAKIPV
ncbi:Optic atrophy 3 protein [Prunus dulcis]|uniref:Optic atrophy 3 protein n=1 Tax=Prunus dulcis TaxID=3755 RepID=A0A5H2XKE5_PRUDU|nr:Optic atrophy 3 protein [Prunus dulcis]